jgi:hypothetical protein
MILQTFGITYNEVKTLKPIPPDIVILIIERLLHEYVAEPVKIPHFRHILLTLVTYEPYKHYKILWKLLRALKRFHYKVPIGRCLILAGLKHLANSYIKEDPTACAEAALELHDTGLYREILAQYTNNLTCHIDNRLYHALRYGSLEEEIEIILSTSYNISYTLRSYILRIDIGLSNPSIEIRKIWKYCSQKNKETLLNSALRFNNEEAIEFIRENDPEFFNTKKEVKWSYFVPTLYYFFGVKVKSIAE